MTAPLSVTSRRSTLSVLLRRSLTSLLLTLVCGCGEGDSGDDIGPLLNADPDGFYSFGQDEWTLERNTETSDSWVGPAGEAMFVITNAPTPRTSALAWATESYESLHECCLDENDYDGDGVDTSITTPESLAVPKGTDSAWYVWSASSLAVYSVFIMHGDNRHQIELSSEAQSLSEAYTRDLLAHMRMHD